ncbi:hypothetical protein FOA52_001122 [Chlamydomonas sp. UWO 241]|nr:hypothetical protein FOA52_001122 [Chlamydomonas sp. UWO 241]
MLLQTGEFEVRSPNVEYTPESITSSYEYTTTKLEREQDGKFIIKPTSIQYQFKTDRRVPKLGVMLVGLGGNNGTTLVGGVLANKHGITWMTKEGVKAPNYFGSLTQASTVRVGNFEGEEVYVPFKSLLPMVEPNDIVFGGWDISSMNMADSMERAKVLDWELQKQLVPLMKDITPLPGIFDASFIAANQGDRATNIIKGSKSEQVEAVRANIREFKASTGVDRVVILWTANTERYSAVVEGVNDTAENLLASIERNEPEVSPSTLYAVAAAQEGVPFVNGSPQNTFVPGMIELAVSKNVLIGGDDFKSGQTKLKSVLVDFLVGAGLKPVSIVSYNHLGNNDGMNLSAPQTFRSKEISKSNVVDDMVESNAILYKPGEHPDHTVVIKYVPYVGDSKRAMDEYTSEIFLNGKNTLVIHNTCEDSLLAAPLILDLVLVSELITRIEMKKDGEEAFHGFHPIAVLLSYLTKAPLVPAGTPVINALSKQRAMLENILRACVGLSPESNMLMEFKRRWTWRRVRWRAWLAAPSAEVLLSKGLAALQQVAEGLGDVRGLLLERLPERALPSHTPPAAAVGQCVRSDVEEPAFGTVRGISEADSTWVDFPGLGSSKLNKVKVLDQPASDSEVEGEEEEEEHEDNSYFITTLVQKLGPDSLPRVQAAAANELGFMAPSDGQNMSAIAAAGAIPALVLVLGSSGSTADVQYAAAFALGKLADGDAKTQAAIAADGAVPGLVQLLHVGDSQHAARALGCLARNNAQNQVVIAAASAIPALVQMLHNKDFRQVAAANALRDLAGGLFGPFMDLYLGSALWPFEGLVAVVLVALPAAWVEAVSGGAALTALRPLRQFCPLPRAGECAAVVEILRLVGWQLPSVITPAGWQRGRPGLCSAAARPAPLPAAAGGGAAGEPRWVGFAHGPGVVGKLTCKLAVVLQLRAVVNERRVRRAATVEATLALDHGPHGGPRATDAQGCAGLRGLEAAVPALWRVPLLNARKEPIWRLWAQEGRVADALQAAESLAKVAVTLAAREHAQAGGEELTQLMRAVAMRLDAAAPASAAQQAERDMVSRALESLAGSSQRTEALLSKGLAALKHVAEGLGDVRGLLLERRSDLDLDRAPPTCTLPALAVGHRVRVRSDVDEPAFGRAEEEGKEEDDMANIDIAALVQQVESWSSSAEREAAITAARALGNLAAGNDETKAAIIAAGAIPALVGNLKFDAAGFASYALSHLVFGCSEPPSIFDLGTIQTLVQLPGPSSSAEEQAAAAQALTGTGKAETIVEEGGIPALMLLLGPRSSTEVQKAAASALDSLAFYHAQNQHAIVAAGAIPALVQLLQGLEGVQDAAAGALRSLAENNTQNQTTIAAAGAIPALVQLLQDVDPESEPGRAAFALGCLADHHAKNQTAIVAAGAFPALIDLLDPNLVPTRCSFADDVFAATVALGNLAANHPQNQTAIAAAGAIPALVGLPGLHWDVSHAVWDAAEEALESLADGHAQNQAAIATAEKERAEA